MQKWSCPVQYGKTGHLTASSSGKNAWMQNKLHFKGWDEECLLSLHVTVMFKSHTDAPLLLGNNWNIFHRYINTHLVEREHIWVCRVPHLRASLPQQKQRWCDHVTPAFPTQQYSTGPVYIHTPSLPPRLALGMADGERSPLLSDLGDGALGSGNGGVSPGSAPYVPNKPESEYPWCSLLQP